MSKVLTQVKNRYQKAIIIESVCLVVLGLFLAIWQRQSAVDFSYGFFKCLFAFLYIHIYHFLQKTKFFNKTDRTLSC